MHRRFRRLNGVMLVVDGTRRTRQVVNLIDLDEEWEGHIVPQKFKSRVAEKVLYILLHASEKIIHTDNLIATSKQSIT